VNAAADATALSKTAPVMVRNLNLINMSYPLIPRCEKTAAFLTAV